MSKEFEGVIDHLIMCHGVVVSKGVLNCTIPNFDSTMLVNVRSVMHLTSLSVPYMKKLDSSSITILTSN
jgi:short-subunit dehydrogenase